YGRVRFVSYIRPAALLVPQKAVTELQGMYQVAVVGSDDRVSVRTVKVGERSGPMWIIDQGLKPGERVVVEGVQKVRDGMPDNMNYMYSLNATGNSQTLLVVNFDVKTDPNNDLILAQSRETQAASQLPTDVTNYGITVRKSVTAPLMLIAVYSPHGSYDAKFL